MLRPLIRLVRIYAELQRERQFKQRNATRYLTLTWAIDHLEKAEQKLCEYKSSKKDQKAPMWSKSRSA